MGVRAVYRGLKAGLLVAIVAAAGCSSGGADILGPLITLTNQWRDETNQNHTFQFNDNTGGTAQRSGTFTGNENTPAGQQYPLTGSWSSNGNIQFTVVRPSGSVTYNGTLTSNLNRISFTSSAGNLVVVRN